MNHYFENFVLWAERCVRISDKLTGASVPFVLNRPQRKVLARLEAMRRAGKPIRLIMLKSRQWGGSTLIQAYMAWMQLVRHKGLNSLTCAHVKDAASAIRGMYSRLLARYPDDELPAPRREWTLAPYERSQSTSWIPARDAIVAVATSQAPNSLRGFNFHLAHLSEVAFWADGDADAAEEIVRTVSGTIPLQPETMVVMESTANGVDNYFYREWKRAEEGKSDKEAVFVAWYEIDMYRTPPLSKAQKCELFASLDSYEKDLMLSQALEPERIAWYHAKRREYPSHEAMMAEFPSSAEEAFLCGSDSFFIPDCRPELHKSLSTVEKLAPASLITIHASEADECLLSVFSKRRSILLPESDTFIGGSRSGLLTETCAIAANRKAPVMILGDPAAAGVVKWLGNEALRRGIPLLYTDEEEASTLLTAPVVQEAAEILREAYRDNKIGETSPEALRQLASFRLSQPRRSPLIMARLGAAMQLSRINNEPRRALSASMRGNALRAIGLDCSPYGRSIVSSWNLRLSGADRGSG